MSREIKFRAWDKKQKKMLYGVSTGTIKVWDENAPLLSHEFSYSEDCIFEQYTGLKDKNGVEINEGDIVAYDGKCTCVIKYDDESARFIHRDISDDFPLGLYNGKLFEVIGNIHENPELMKGGEE